MGMQFKGTGTQKKTSAVAFHFFTLKPQEFGATLSRSEACELTCLDVAEPEQNTCLDSISQSVFEGPVAAGFADKVLQQIVVHVSEGLRLSHGRQVVNAKLETELFQILHMKSGWTDSMRKRTTTKDLQNNI